jgi:hypothetical protein
MITSPSLRRAVPGEPITASRFNELIDMVNLLLRGSGGAGMRRLSSSDGDSSRPFHSTFLRIGKTGGGGIPALTTISGRDTPGSALVAWSEFDQVQLQGAETSLCFNISSNAIGASKYIIAGIIGGQPFVLVESC